MNHGGRDNSFALDGDQRGGLGERHPHLEARDVARLVLRMLGQQVDPILVVALEPQALRAGDEHFGVRRARVAGVVAHGGLHLQPSR